MNSMTTVNDRIASLQATLALTSLDQEMETLARETVPLTRQTPYTLFTMRAVEIGLPVLLSIASLVFLLRYSLTEARSHEIKNLLKQRNEARAMTSNP
jgi:Na+/melibiose symporter-like transporter